MQENAELRQSMGQVASSAAFAGVLMLLVGFWLDLSGISDSVIYNTSVSVFNWTMRVGGIAMLVIAVLAYVGWRPILAIDFVVSGLTGLIMIAVALIWLLNGDLLNGVLVLFFGGMFVRSGMSSWSLLRAAGSPTPVSRVFESPISVESQETGETSESGSLAASLRSARQQTDERVEKPKPDEPDPEGFLADLGRSSSDD